MTLVEMLLSSATGCGSHWGPPAEARAALWGLAGAGCLPGVASSSARVVLRCSRPPVWQDALDPGVAGDDLARRAAHAGEHDQQNVVVEAGVLLILLASCMPVIPGMSRSSRTTSKYSFRWALVRSRASASCPRRPRSHPAPAAALLHQYLAAGVVVVDDQQARALQRAVGSALFCARPSPARGRLIHSVLPWLAPVWMPKSPSISWTSWRAMIRPSRPPCRVAARKSWLSTAALSSASRS